MSLAEQSVALERPLGKPIATGGSVVESYPQAHACTEWEDLPSPSGTAAAVRCIEIESVHHDRITHGGCKHSYALLSLTMQVHV
jgi:hypothetical protein